jgi:hypothetical protein
MDSRHIHFWGILGGVNSGFSPDFFPNDPLANMDQKWDENRFIDSRNLMSALFGRGLKLQIDSIDGVFGVTFFKKTLTKDGRDAYTAGTLYTNVNQLDVPFKNQDSIYKSLDECFDQQVSYQPGSMAYPKQEDIQLSRTSPDSALSKEARKIVVLTGFRESNDYSHLFEKLKNFNWSNYTLYILQGSLSNDFEEVIRAEMASFENNPTFLDRRQPEKLKELLYIEPTGLPEPSQGLGGKVSSSLLWLVAFSCLALGLITGFSFSTVFGGRAAAFSMTYDDVELKNIELSKTEVNPGDTIDITLVFSCSHFLKDSIKMELRCTDTTFSRLPFQIINSEKNKLTVRTVFPIDTSYKDKKLFCSYKDSQLEDLLSHGTSPHPGSGAITVEPSPPALPLPLEWSEPIPLKDITKENNNEFRKWVNSTEDLQKTYGVGSGFNLKNAGLKNRYFDKAYSAWYEQFVGEPNSVNPNQGDVNLPNDDITANPNEIDTSPVPTSGADSTHSPTHD